MKRGALILLIVLASCAVVRGVDKENGEGGILGALRGAPDHQDDDTSPGTGKPGRAKSETSDAPVDVPTGGTLRDEIARLEKQIAEMEKVTPANVEHVDSLAEAEKHISRLQQNLDETRKDLTALDRADTARLAQRKQQFDRKWSDHADTIKAGKVPEDADPMEWARLCDEYFRQKADVEAYFAASGERLKRMMAARTAPLEKALKEASKHAELLRRMQKDFSPGQRKFMARMMGWKLHKAELIAARHKLRNLRKLLADLEGASEARDDPIEQETVEKSGYLLADALRMLVLREMQLSDATRFPSEVDLDGGLPLSDWQRILEQPARQKAKVKWVAEQLRLAHEEYRHAEARVKAGDQAFLNRMRAQGASQDYIRRKQAELRQTRPKRISDRKSAAQGDIALYKKMLKEETAELTGMSKPRTQPAETGGD